VRLLLFTVVALLVGSTAAGAAEKPIAVASNTGGGTVTVSGQDANRWHVVITTRPTGLTVLVQVAGGRARVSKAPVVLDYTCSHCATRVIARLSSTAMKPAARAATIRAALYRR
jgi:hypothetical protein